MKKWKEVFSLVLTAVMLLSLLPVNGLAAELEEGEAATVIVEEAAAPQVEEDAAAEAAAAEEPAVEAAAAEEPVPELTPVKLPSLGPVAAPMAETVTLTFDANGHGPQLEPQKVEKGTAPAEPSAPFDPNYHFLGWYTDVGCTTKFDFNAPLSVNTTVYAKWGEKTVITQQPASVKANLNSNVVFTVDATGVGLTYQWQFSSDGKTWSNSSLAGATTKSMTVQALSVRNNLMYRCMVKDSFGYTTYSDAAVLQLNTTAKVAITKQPQNYSGAVGSTAVFTVEATGPSLTYQWQYSSDSKTWYNSGCAGAKTPSISVVATTANNGMKYRCVVKSGSTTLYSNRAFLYVTGSNLTIITHPADCTTPLGETAVFSVQVQGDALSYQWQYSGDNGKTWKNTTLATGTTSKLSVKAQKANNGIRYRCMVSDGHGFTAYSNAAKLTVTQFGPTITTQPVDYTGVVGEKATFTVEAVGTGLTYQWQFSANGSSVWSNSTLSGAKTKKLTVVLSKDNNNILYRCAVKDSDGNITYSDGALLRVVPNPVIITNQPRDYVGAVATTAVFNVTATGSGLTYKWQYFPLNGTAWVDAVDDSVTSGATTNTISVKLTNGTGGTNNRRYRCIVEDSSGHKVTSNQATMWIGTGNVTIIEQPKSFTGTEGMQTVFSVEAVGTGLTYQWQYAPSTGDNWQNSTLPGSNTPNLYVDLIKVRDGIRYRCVVTDVTYQTGTSEAATLRVVDPLVIRKHPASWSGKLGQTATFTVTATGTNLVYQWEFSGDGINWSKSGLPGSNTATLQVGAIAERNGLYYRCVIRDGFGNSATTNMAKMTVKA